MIEGLIWKREGLLWVGRTPKQLAKWHGVYVATHPNWYYIDVFTQHGGGPRYSVRGPLIVSGKSFPDLDSAFHWADQVVRKGERV